MQQEDELIIQMVLQGRHSAYTILVNRYQAYVFTLVLRYINDRGLAEELAQDVFVKAYRSLADFKGNSKFSTWLYTIVSTTCISYLRKRKDEMVLLGQERLHSLSDHLSDNETADDMMERKSSKKILSVAIMMLPQDDAQVITLFYQLEQSIEEIAIILGATANNVKVKLHRARQKLRVVIDAKFINELK